MGARKLMCMYLENNEMSAAGRMSEVETGTVPRGADESHEEEKEADGSHDE